MAPKLKFDESIVSGRKARKPEDINSPQQPLSSAHDWKKVMGVVQEEENREVEVPLQSFGLLDSENHQVGELKGKLLELNKTLINDHLETVLSTDENFFEWIEKISRIGYVYLSPSLDINKTDPKRKNTGKTEREDLSENKANEYYVVPECWWWDDEQKKQHKAQAIKTIGQAQKVIAQIRDVYNAMWAREKDNFSVLPPSEAKVKTIPDRKEKKVAAATTVPTIAPASTETTTAATTKKTPLSAVEMTKRLEFGLGQKQQKEEEANKYMNDFSDFFKWFRAYKTRSELVEFQKEQKQKLNTAVRSRLAIKRLMRDLKDCHKYPIPGIAAFPVADNDLRLWHCNITAPPSHPWRGRVFHLSMKFPEHYPEKPPVVRALTPIFHPNVFGDYVCLDMLCAPGSRFEPKNKEVTGWTSAYSVQSILLQLQAFLLAPSFVAKIIPDKEDWIKQNAHTIGYNRYDAKGKPLPSDELQIVKKAAYDRAYAQSFSSVAFENAGERIRLLLGAAYKCNHCGHTFSKHKPPCPPFDHPTIAAAAVVGGGGGAARLPTALGGPVSSSITAVATVAPAQETKLTPSVIFSTLLSAEAPEVNISLPPIVNDAHKPSGGPLDTTTHTGGLLSLQKGDMLIGTVKRYVKDIGALVDVKWDREREGMVHISQIPKLPNQVVKHIDELVKIGEKVTVRVTEVDEGWGRLGLSMKPAPLVATPTNKRVGGGSSSSESRSEGKDVLPGTICAGVVKAVKERMAFVDVGAKRDGMLDLPFPLLSRAEKKNGSAGADYLWWDVAKVLRSHVGKKIKVLVDSVDERPHLVLPPSVQLSGTSNRLPARANAIVTGERSRTSWDELCEKDDLMMLTLSYLSRAELYLFCSSKPPKEDTVVASKVRLHAASTILTEFIRPELVCFHSRVTFEEDLLGVGLTLEYYDSGDLNSISPNLDLISENAFYFEKIRAGVWQTPFTHFLPLYLSQRHAGNLERHEQAIAEIAKNKTLKNTKVVFHPAMVLKVLPSLLNTMIVEIMKGKTHESEVALQGYLSFYHLFLAFVLKYPELQREIDSRVRVFLESEKGRMKRVCPNLGEWLACLACSSCYSWKQVAVAVLTEVFDRNVKWTVMEFPELVNLRELEEQEQEQEQIEEQEAKQEAVLVVEPSKVSDIISAPVAGLSKSARRRLREKKGAAWEAAAATSKTAPQVKVHVIAEEPDLQGLKLDRGRLPKTWKVTTTSSRLIMFHVLFLRMFRLAPLSGKSEDEEDMEVSLLSVEQAKRKLDQSYGRATHLMTQLFQRGVKRILDTPDWSGFFTRCLLPVPDPNFLCRWLQRAAMNSGRKRYHNADAVNAAMGEIKAASKAKRDAERAARDPLAHFDEDERAALGRGFGDHEKHSEKYDKYENTRGGGGGRYDY